MRGSPGSQGWAIFAITAWSVTIGVLSRRIAKPLEPEQSRWLDAIERATLAALEPEPSDAIRASLSELTRLHPNARSRPELWYVDPAVVKSVDVAGQLHERTARLPDSLVELAAVEPEQTLRLEVLRAIQVRRADVRPLVAWFEDQGTFTGTLLQSESGPVGVLCMPTGGRTSTLALEEAQALKRLGARIGALLSIGAAQARSRLRELESANRCVALEQRIEQLEKTAEHELKGHRQGPEGLARAVRNGCYSASSKLALESVERHARLQLNQSIMLPLGVEARGWAAIAHFASPRKDGPFVVVDPVSTSDPPTPWLDPVGQEKKLGGGNLVLIDPTALPLAAQRAIALWLATSSSDSKTGVGCIVVTRLPLRVLLESSRIDESLARRFTDFETEIPQLAERAEDLRAMVLEKTARLGMSVLGEPSAVEPAVLAELLDYDWPGNDLELESVLARLVASAQSPLITLEHLERIRFASRGQDELSGTPLPTHPSFRPPPRTISQRPR